MQYINAERQKQMVAMLDRFYILQDSGVEKNKETDAIMNELFKEFDKIIIGIIRSPLYKFYQYADEDDLISEARWHIYQSVIKRQWDPSRGASLFSFFSTVVSNNLKSYTRKTKKKSNRFVGIELSEINDTSIQWKEDQDEGFVNTYIFDEIEAFFFENDKNKFYSLSLVFKQYFIENKHTKFKKKDFISYAASFGYSQSFCNTFFEHLKKIKSLKNIWEYLFKDNFNSNKKVQYKIFNETP